LLILSIILFRNVRKKYKHIENSYEKFNKLYEPAKVKERILVPLRYKYSSLQNSYSKDLNELRCNEKLLSAYNIGVGTVDAEPYQEISSSRDLSELKGNLENTQEQIKVLVKNKSACICGYGNDIYVNGKKSEAKKLFNREVKLRVRCLDNEFKSSAALVDWNNVNRIIYRTKSSFEEINSLGRIVKTYLQKEYLDLKVKEFRLNYEIDKTIQELKDEERMEVRFKRESEREEKRIKAALLKAKKEREIMEIMVAEEMKGLESASEEQKLLLTLHQKELEILKERERRAKSLAQTTRAGYVYVISNELAFGNEICKIGMTRRADPNVRVRELGNASVPDLFDVHAYMFTDDAPKLEKYLHDTFANNRVNMANKRKEFFMVKPQNVLEAVGNYDGQLEITETVDVL